MYRHASSSLRSQILIFAFQSAKINKCETICESHTFGTISSAGTTAGTTNSTKGAPAVIPVAATPTVATGMIATLAASQHFVTAAPITAAPPICSKP